MKSSTLVVGGGIAGIVAALRARRRECGVAWAEGFVLCRELNALTTPGRSA